MPTDPYNLQRFVDAQDGVFDIALAELRAGEKRGHWMWFILPQLAGLGRSPTTQFYGIISADEARAYLAHSVLGPRLRRCVEALHPWANQRTPEAILGPIDAVKLRSSLTLFDAAEPDSVFRRALDAFFDGQVDERTLALLAAPG
jgi:uncharacterized protein (DUF1810 family)